MAGWPVNRILSCNLAESLAEEAAYTVCVAPLVAARTVLVLDGTGCAGQALQDFCLLSSEWSATGFPMGRRTVEGSDVEGRPWDYLS